LQRLQQVQREKEGSGSEYLELRSRTLKKLSPPVPARRRRGGKKAAAGQDEAGVSFGENMLQSEGIERSTRETTPCSLIINLGTIRSPGSTTRPNHSSHRRVEDPVDFIDIPMDGKDYFDGKERRRQQAFMDKYNFDPVDDCPLPGRYEWVKLD
ncbi:Cyclin-dependent kinase inhibitor 4, partial [Dichanthelium oligosanthes]